MQSLTEESIHILKKESLHSDPESLFGLEICGLAYIPIDAHYDNNRGDLRENTLL
ncbi:hypothetical protein Hanom_Chr06g00578911 [Helianthus anomalus]